MTHPKGSVIAAATDGACSGNPGPGGWGALIRFENGTVEEFGGHEPATTNNRMELQAALAIMQKLKTLPRAPNLKIRTDSKYLIDGLSKWITGWKKKGWKTSGGKPVLNQDLWQALDKARLHDVQLEYVKGHSGDPDNERVDKIAVQFSKGSFKSREKDINIPTDDLPQLIKKLDFLDHLAKNKYSISSNELAEIIDLSIKEIEKNTGPWEWRDWVINPTNNKLWRIKRLESKDYKIRA